MLRCDPAKQSILQANRSQLQRQSRSKSSITSLRRRLHQLWFIMKRLWCNSKVATIRCSTQWSRHQSSATCSAMKSMNGLLVNNAKSRQNGPSATVSVAKNKRAATARKKNHAPVADLQTQARVVQAGDQVAVPILAPVAVIGGQVAVPILAPAAQAGIDV